MTLPLSCRPWMATCLVMVMALTLVRVESSCPNVRPVNVAWSDYTGLWYEIAVSPLPRVTYEADCKCTQARYTPSLVDKESLVVENACRQPSLMWDYVRGTARIRGPGQLGVKFSMWMPEGDYQVIDYQSGQYAVVWSCSEFLGYTYGQALWIWSRKPTMDPWTYNALLRKANMLTGFDTSSMIPTDQQSCFI